MKTTTRLTGGGEDVVAAKVGEDEAAELSSIYLQFASYFFPTFRLTCLCFSASFRLKGDSGKK
jgi:hypothetical protein